MKRKLSVLLSITLCFAMLLSACNPAEDTANPTVTPPTEPESDSVYVIDFSDGNMDYLLLNRGLADSDPDSSMEIADLDGGKALKLSNPNGHALRVGIAVDTLLGGAVTDVRNVEFDIFAEYPGGNFHAVMGELTAITGTENGAVKTDDWTIYLESRNPNSGRLKAIGEHFSASGGNLLEFSIMRNGTKRDLDAEDGGDEAAVDPNYETPAVIYIKSITFLSEKNEPLAVNLNAGWAGPEGYGDMSITAVMDLTAPDMSESKGAIEYYKFPIAHIVDLNSIFSITYTSPSDSAPAIIFKAPKNWWAQYQIKADMSDRFWELDEENSTESLFHYTINFPVSVIERNFEGVVVGPESASTSWERGVVITNWAAGFNITSFKVLNATGLPVPVGNHEDLGDGKLQYDIAHLLTPESVIEVVLTPEDLLAEPTVDKYTMVVGGTVIEATELISAEGQYNAKFDISGLDFSLIEGAEGIIFTEGSSETEITFITIFNPKL